MKELGITDRLIHSTVRIECQDAAGNISSGSGFIFGFARSGDRCFPGLITNKHVVKGAVKGKFHMTLRASDGGPSLGDHVATEIADFESQCFMHPDPNVDLAVFPLGPFFNSEEQQGRNYFYIILDDSILPQPEFIESLTTMEDIIMIGYPNGIWDSHSNLPVIRKGITATHAAKSFGGKDEFLIDAACFPGSSGSPVFLCNIGSYPDKDGNLIVGTRLGILGVLYAGPQHTATGEIVLAPVPTNQKPVSVSSIPNNLGLVIQVKKIRDFDALFRPLM
jgi:hypothetical protein